MPSTGFVCVTVAVVATGVVVAPVVPLAAGAAAFLSPSVELGNEICRIDVPVSSAIR